MRKMLEKIGYDIYKRSDLIWKRFTLMKRGDGYFVNKHDNDN